MRKLRQHAMDLSDLARHNAKDVVFESYPERGWNMRMTDMQAALGLCQLEALDEILAERTRQAERYSAALAALPGLETPFEPGYAVRTWQSYAVRRQPVVAGRAHRADAPAACATASRRAAGSWRSTTRTRTRAATCCCRTPTRRPATCSCCRCSPGSADEQQDYVIDRLGAHLVALAA